MQSVAHRNFNRFTTAKTAPLRTVRRVRRVRRPQFSQQRVCVTATGDDGDGDDQSSVHTLLHEMRRCFCSAGSETPHRIAVHTASCVGILCCGKCRRYSEEVRPSVVSHMQRVRVILLAHKRVDGMECNYTKPQMYPSKSRELCVVCYLKKWNNNA